MLQIILISPDTNYLIIDIRVAKLFIKILYLKIDKILPLYSITKICRLYLVISQMSF